MSVVAERDWRTESVLVATPHRPEVAANFTFSLLAMLAYDLQSHGVVARGGGPLGYPASSMNLPKIRNDICTLLLDELTADWLLFVDADAGFEPDVAERLMEAADPVERPVVGALAFMVSKRRPDGKGGFVWNPAPTLYKWGHVSPDGSKKDGFFPIYDYLDNTVMRVAATGCHTLLIHRTVLEKLRAAEGSDDWFSRRVLFSDQGLMGEDFSFCARLARLQIPLHVHTGVKTTHQQTVWLCEEQYKGALMVSRISDAANDMAGGDVPPGVQVVTE